MNGQHDGAVNLGQCEDEICWLFVFLPGLRRFIGDESFAGVYALLLVGRDGLVNSEGIICPVSGLTAVVAGWCPW